jgi:predicted hotdog family 3-hydroxylacyl-ACP dehydratase
MLLIDEVIHSSNEDIATSCLVSAATLFATDEGLPSFVGIELMAQTMAAWAGTRAQKNNTPVQLGFLLGTRRYECVLNHFPLGSTLIIKAREELVSPEGLAVFQCEIYLYETKVAWAQMNAFQPPDVEKYLSGDSSV